jgi:tagatose-6-phosphate ketose/aldose isomerase
MDSSVRATQADWQYALAQRQEKAAELLGRPEAEQRRLGYFHTLHEICQQPWTWLRTCERMIQSREALASTLAGVRCLTLTGSGSSQYAAECVIAALQIGLKLPIGSVGGGDLLIYGAKALPTARPGLIISLARSGDSPESRGAIELLVDAEPQLRHIVITCNEHGGLTKIWRGHAKVQVITLPPETNDQSLVMTSSFTNLALALRFIGMPNETEEYSRLCMGLSEIAKNVIATNFDNLAKIGGMNFERVVFLGTGSRLAASREAALKMLEMTGGRVTTLCEAYLAFRHGPMSYINEKTLVVAFLSANPVLRAYELDLLQELDRKSLGLSKLVVGEAIPHRILRRQDFAVECPGLSSFDDEDAATIHVVVAQLLGFFRCLKEGLRPDSPSEDGIISRVVESFPLHSSS